MGPNMISVVIGVFNEEARIEKTLKCLGWCDDIIVIDKSSTDRTGEIVRRYTDRVITVPFSETGDEGKLGIQAARHEWVLQMTASDLLHPGLVDRLQALLRQDPFPYDIVAVPYVVYYLGIHDKHSPWYIPTKKRLFRKSVVQTRNKVHREVFFTSKRVYKMRPNNVEAMFHITETSMDAFFARVIRYCHAEPTKYPSRAKGLWISFWEIMLYLGWLIIVKRVFMLGWNGIALGLGILVYQASKFLYIWEKYRDNSHQNELQQNIIMEWEKRKTGS